MNISKKAKRLYFSVNINNLFNEDVIEFEWFPGFAKVQKEKSIISMHQNIRKKENNKDLKILEVSSNSTELLGRSLSAFNLQFRDIPIECIFQGSKVFSDGGPYLELLVKRTSLTIKRAFIDTKRNLLIEFYISKYCKTSI